MPAWKWKQHVESWISAEELAGKLRAAGYEILDCRYVGFCEMIFKAKKPRTNKKSLPVSKS